MLLLIACRIALGMDVLLVMISVGLACIAIRILARAAILFSIEQNQAALAYVQPLT